MTIDKNKVVAVSYELEVEGSIADKAGSEKPLEYIHGTGMLLPKFEAALEGKEPGASFDFTLTPEEGYGNYSDEWKIEIPKTSFAGPDGKIREDLLVVGFTIPMLNSEGQVIQGTVAAVSDDTVTMDFNHPMACTANIFQRKVAIAADTAVKVVTAVAARAANALAEKERKTAVAAAANSLR